MLPELVEEPPELPDEHAEIAKKSEVKIKILFFIKTPLKVYSFAFAFV